MSFKGPIEDKAEASPMPRSCQALLDVTRELRQAFSRGDHDATRRVLEDLEKSWVRAQQDNIHVYSRQGDQENCQRFASALNDANVAMGAAVALLGPGHRGRS